MATPRFQLVPARVPGRTGVTEWVRASADSGPLLWRLLGANNRELGRSARAYPDAASCERALVRLASSLDGSVSGVVPVADGFGWRWQVLCDGEVLASSVKVMPHERDALRALHQFLATVPDAVERWRASRD